MWSGDDAPNLLHVSDGEADPTVKVDEDKDDVDKLEQLNWYKDKPEFPHFFPYLAWEKVMEFITTKDEIENCYNCCSYFRQFLLEKRKRKVVLPQVFQILLKKHHYPNFVRQHSNWREWDGYLKYRYVCKSVNSVVEEVYEEHTFDDWGRCRYWLCNPQKFLDHFEMTHYDSTKGRPKKNPFFGRRVHIYENDFRFPIDNIQDFRSGIIEIFRKYGHEIRRLVLSLHEYEQEIQLVRLYRQLQDMMTLTPNLQYFNVEFYKPRHVSDVEVEGLKQEITMNPIPRLPELKRVSSHFGILPDAILHQLILPNQHTELDLCYFYRPFHVVARRLPNLRSLKLRICSTEAWSYFENSSKLNLQKFTLYITRHLGKTITWSRVFRALETTLDTEMCTELHILMPQPDNIHQKMLVLEDSHVYKLKMPKLQVFTIETCCTQFCLDFLLSCKDSLKKITIVDTTERRWDSNTFQASREYVMMGDFVDQIRGSRYDVYKKWQIIQFLDYENNMQNSNISSKLPNLATLIMQKNSLITGKMVSYAFKADGVKLTITDTVREGLYDL